MHKLLTSEHAGFSGLTHWLIANMLFLLLWLTPIGFAQDYIESIRSSWFFAFLIFMVVGGASLLPDLDSSPLQEGGSTAVYQLGALGNALSMLAITISGVIWNILHTKNDEKPPSQHRMLFHAPIITIGLWALNQFGYESSSATCLSIGIKTCPFTALFMVFLSAISAYLGASMLFYKLLKLIGKQKWTQIFCLIIMGITVWRCLVMPFYQLKLMGTAVALGWLFHILGDMITKGTAPFFFPIPTPVKSGNKLGLRLWWKPHPFGGKFLITTGGVINVILNFALIGVDAFLIWFVLLRR